MSKAEILQIINEFEEVIKRTDTSTSHQEEAHHLQLSFTDDVKKLAIEIREIGNPFLETECELITLDSRNIMDPEVTKSLKQASSIGTDLHNEYMKKIIEETSLAVSETMKYQALYTFENQPVPVYNTK